MSGIFERFTEIKSRIEAAADGRSIRIIAVTKTVKPPMIETAYAAGAHVFGENRIQEALPKMEALKALAAEWHFIGHLQTNKARDAVRHFRMIHSVDSERLLDRIDQEAMKIGKTMDILVEVNLGGEESKSGTSPAQLPALLHHSQSAPNIRVCGLMTVPPWIEDPERVRPYFRQLRELRDSNQAEYPGLTELSMGMSHDFVVAIEEGATMVRIGTALFGERKEEGK